MKTLISIILLAALAFSCSKEEEKGYVPVIHEVTPSETKHVVNPKEKVGEPTKASEPYPYPSGVIEPAPVVVHPEEPTEPSEPVVIDPVTPNEPPVVVTPPVIIPPVVVIPPVVEEPAMAPNAFESFDVTVHGSGRVGETTLSCPSMTTTNPDGKSLGYSYFWEKKAQGGVWERTDSVYQDFTLSATGVFFKGLPSYRCAVVAVNRARLTTTGYSNEFKTVNTPAIGSLYLVDNALYLAAQDELTVEQASRVDNYFDADGMAPVMKMIIPESCSYLSHNGFHVESMLWPDNVNPAPSQITTISVDVETVPKLDSVICHITLQLTDGVAVVASQDIIIRTYFAPQ